MNRFDAALNRKRVFVSIKDGIECKCNIMARGIGEFFTTQDLKKDDLVTLDKDNMVVKIDDHTLSIGYVMEYIEVWKRVQDENTVVVATFDKPLRGFLHEHPGLQRKLDDKHVVVDRDDWIRARRVLSGFGFSSKKLKGEWTNLL